MPIRINLLAEAQAAEELRRKDPVKRAVILGAACVGLMAAASLVIQSQVMRANSAGDAFKDRIQAITNDYAAVMQNNQHLSQMTLNMRGLDILASERFLNGTLLNALQKVHVENVQLVHLRTDHTYTLTAETKPKPGSSGSQVTKPATIAEKISLVIEARDSSPNPGDQVTKFKDALTKNSSLEQMIGTNTDIRLVNLSPPQVAPDSGQPIVQFTLEAQLPEKVRLGISSSKRYTSAPAAASIAAKKTDRTQPKL